MNSWPQYGEEGFREAPLQARERLTAIRAGWKSPLKVDKSLIKISIYSPSKLSAEEKELQTITLALLDEVNDRDKTLVE